MKNMMLSCIVLTCKSYQMKGGCVEHTLLSLTQQKGITFEIIVVENSGFHLDRELLHRFLSTGAIRPRVQVGHCHTSIAAARNFGARMSRGDVLVFMDDDTILLDECTLRRVIDQARNYAHGYGANRLWTNPPGWFEQHSVKLRDELLSGKVSRLVYALDLPDPSLRHKSNSKYLTRSFPGNFGFVNANVFFAIGGFPEIFQGYGYEDDALAFLLYFKHGQPASLADITIAHISHSSDAVEKGLERQNETTYDFLLQATGIRVFHVGDLLYPTTSISRAALERL